MNDRNDLNNVPHHTPDSNTGFVDAPVAAAHFGVSKTHLYRLARRKTIPCKRIGRRVRFRLADLEAHFDQPPVEPTPPANHSRRGSKAPIIATTRPNRGRTRQKPAFVSMRSGSRQQAEAGTNSKPPPSTSRCSGG